MTMDHERLRKLIDACRPGRDDWREPEMAELAERLAHDPEARAVFERSQRLDAALGAAFRDAPAPADLEQRLLAAVGAAAPEASAAPDAVAEEGAVAREVRARRISRRALIAASLAAGVMLALGLAGYQIFRQQQEISREQLIAQAQQWVGDEDFQDDAAWRPVTDREMAFFPAHFLNAAPSHWRRWATAWDRRATAFRVPVRGQWAYLFVLDAEIKIPGLGARPSRTPLPGASGGWKATAWTEHGALYVLLFEGDYRILLRNLPPTV